MNEAVLVPVLHAHRFDVDRLDAYLRDHIEGFEGITAVHQFQGGQSNPTFKLETRGQDFVLRKKPPGVLLSSAHAVEREHAVMHALADSPVPVPVLALLCEDTSVVGTPFYLMQHVAGRVFADPRLENVQATQRRPIYFEMMRTLAALHQVDWRRAGLQTFGKPESYLARQVARWTRQYEVSDIPSPAMDLLCRWVATHVPSNDASGSSATIAHGDFRVGNLIYDTEFPTVRAVIDWELATIGHPMADLAYSCLAWRVPPELNGLVGVEDPALPAEAELLQAYCEAARITLPADFEFFVAFALFRWAAILAGVYRRALNGNAADARGLDAGRRFEKTAEAGWRVAQAA